MKIPGLYEHVLRHLRTLVSHSPDRSVALPTEAELCRKFQVSRITVRRAYAELERENLVHRMPRRGTFSRPNALPHSALLKGNNLVIGLVESSQWDLSSQLVGQCVRHATQRAEQYGFTLAIMPIDTADVERSRRGLLRHLQILSPSGLLLDARLPHPVLAWLRSSKIPCVAMYEDPRLPRDVPSVHCSTAGILHLLLQHLKAHNHERIGYLAGYTVAWAAAATASPAPGVWRAEGLTLRKSYFMNGPYGVASGQHLAHQVLNARPCPSALICGDDLMALGAWQAARDEGRRVPEDLALAGIGNFLDPSLNFLPLTSVDPGFAEITRQAVDLLHQQIQGLPTPLRTLMEPRLIPRGSCGEKPGVTPESVRPSS